MMPDTTQAASVNHGSTRTWETNPGAPSLNSVQASNSFSGMSAMGWLASVVIVVIMYDKFPKTREFLSGVLVLVALGIALRYQSKVTGTFHQLFFTQT